MTKFNRVLTIIGMLALASCSSSTQYQSVIGKPEMLANKNILVSSIEGVSDRRSQDNFFILQRNLSSSFGKIVFLPTSEYDLAKKGVSENASKKMYSDIGVRKKISNLLNVDYILKISLNKIATSAQQRSAVLSDKTVYTFKIFDVFQPSPIAQFNIVVKSAKSGMYQDATTGFVYATAEVNEEKKAISRATKEILKRCIYNY